MRILGFLLVALLVHAPASARRTPTVGGAVPFAGGLAGPEGIAFERRGHFVVGTTAGQILRFDADGTHTVVGDVGETLAGVTVLRDGRILAASFGPGRIWEVDPRTGAARVFASGVAGANFVVETRQRRILASASIAGTIVDVTDGTPVVRAGGLTFPNGLAVGPGRALYVAETVPGRVLRLPLARDGTLGAAEPYATGLTAVDGIAFDAGKNLLAVGGGALFIVPRGQTAAMTLSTDPLLDGPSNVAFGRGGRGFVARDLYVVNFGNPLGSGTTIVRFPYRRSGR